MSEESKVPPCLDRIADGCHYGVSDAEYRDRGGKWGGRMNPSTLERGTDTMADLKAEWDGLIPHKESKSLDRGTALHLAMLQPDEFKTRYVIGEQCSAIIASGKNEGNACPNVAIMRSSGQWLCGTHGRGAAKDPIEILPLDSYNEIVGMSTAARQHNAIKLFRQQSGHEVSLAWHDPKTKLAMKTRLDKWLPKCVWSSGDVSPCILDVKSCSFPLDDHSIWKQIKDWGYHRKAGAHREAIRVLSRDPVACKALGLDGPVDELEYVLVFLGDKPPWHVRVKNLAVESMSESGESFAVWLDIGEQEYRDLLDTWAHCCKSGVFPGYDDGEVTPVRIYDWEVKKYRAVMAQKASPQ